MKKRLVNFLGKTDKCNLENVCELSLGKGETMETVVNDYINFISTQQFSI